PLPEAEPAPLPDAIPLQPATTLPSPETAAEPVQLDWLLPPEAEPLPPAMAALDAVEVIVPARAAPLPEPAPEPAPRPAKVSVPEPEWNEVPIREAPMRRPKRKFRKGNFVSLIPGIEDYYVGLAALGVIWIVLALLVIFKPDFFWVPIGLGFFIWLCGAFWLKQSMEELDLLWRLALPFIPFIAIAYAFAHPDRALRPVLVTIMGILIMCTGFTVVWSKHKPADRPGEVQPVDDWR